MQDPKIYRWCCDPATQIYFRVDDTRKKRRALNPQLLDSLGEQFRAPCREYIPGDHRRFA
jgi:hypothetical protein